METAQFNTSNGQSHDPSLRDAQASLSTPISPEVPSLKPEQTKTTLPQPPKITTTLTPQTQLTGAAALADRQQPPQPPHIVTDDGKNKAKDSVTDMTPNPAASVLASYPMSRSVVQPQETQPHKGLAGLPSIATAANAMDTSNSNPTPNTASTSSTTGSLTSVSSTPATAGPLSSTSTTDPALLHADTSHPSYQPIGRHDFQTTPTTPFSAATPATPFSPTTPGGSRGKHTCPHCNQTFTRHHNLKSHLLTHSHEKPFLCQTCQSRFRRLHDLKRHSKLHTGERPHVCNKCGRKFARGDALARHARAEGGCAGRRSSMVGMINEDGSMVESDGMDGLESLIHGDADGDVDMLSDSTGTAARRRSLPSIRTDFSQQGQQQGNNPITPASGVSTAYTPTPGVLHANTYPMSTPRTPLLKVQESPKEQVAPTANMNSGNQEGGMYVYVRNLEERVRSLEKTVVELREELAVLKPAAETAES